MKIHFRKKFYEANPHLPDMPFFENDDEGIVHWAFLFAHHESPYAYLPDSDRASEAAFHAGYGDITKEKLNTLGRELSELKHTRAIELAKYVLRLTGNQGHMEYVRSLLAMKGHIIKTMGDPEALSNTHKNKVLMAEMKDNLVEKIDNKIKGLIANLQKGGDKDNLPNESNTSSIFEISSIK